MPSYSIHLAPRRAYPSVTKVIIQIPCYDEDECLPHVLAGGTGHVQSRILAALLMTLGLFRRRLKQVGSGMRRGNT